MQEKKIKGGPGQPGPPFILKDIGQVRNLGIVAHSTVKER